MSVNLQADRFHCWSCEWGGSLVKLFVHLFGKSSEEVDEYVRSIELLRGIKRVAPEREYDEPILPEGFKPLSNRSSSYQWMRAMDYLAGRGVGSDDILMHRLGYCEEGEYRDRIVFPSFDAFGGLNFVIGRAIRSGVTRYQHGNYSKDIIFNECTIDWESPVVLTEGPFDAINAGENAIPLLGSRLSEESNLFRKIVTAGVEVYFAMDADAFEKQLHIMRSFAYYGVGVRYVDLMGRKDVGEMSKDEFQERKKKALVMRSDLDMLRLRISA